MKKIINYSAIISFLAFIQIAANAQTQFLDCTNQNSLQNAIVNETSTNKWIGNTDENGNINIPGNITSITISHPNFGTLSINSFATVVCMDAHSTTLEELIIDNGSTVKKQLMSIFENSYKTFKKDNKGKRYYQIDFNINENHKKLESFGGILALGNVLNSSFNNYSLYWDSEINKNKTYQKLPSYEYISHTEEGIFTDKRTYQIVKDFIEKNKVQKIGNAYIVYKDTDDDFITFNIDSENQLISKYQNTLVLKRNKPIEFSSNDEVLMGNVEVYYETKDQYYIKTLSVQEKYLIENNIIDSNSLIRQLKLSKEEQKNLIGKGIIGFVVDYVEKKKSI